MKNIALLLAGFFCAQMPAWAQTNAEVFGQNRVQLRTFDWKYYETNNLKIYFYDRAGVELSRYVAEQMDKDLSLIQKTIGDVLPDGFDVIVYNSYDDYQQSNIGLASSTTIQNSGSGQINIIGNKLVVYFTGQHVDLKRQLRRGLYSIILEKTLFGETIAEALKNSLVLNFPKWYSEGYLEYVVDGWDSKANSEWKSIILNPNETKKFEQLAMKYPTLSGKAFWKYLTERYGERNVRDFIFIAQNETNLNTATKVLTGKKLVPLFDSLLSFYQNVYALDAANQNDVTAEEPLIVIDNKDPERKISGIKVSPRGLDVAYIASKHGKWEVVLQKSQKLEGDAKNVLATIVAGGYINHNEALDPNYPIPAWSNTGYKLGVIYKKYDQLYLRVYDAVKAKITNHIISKRKFDRILSFTFMEDDDMIVVSAVKNGQSDIFEYRLKRGQVTQITDDPYDDLEPVYVSGGSRKGIVFLSNRPEPFINIKPLPNELPIGKMRGYFYNATTKSMELLPLTPTELGDVTQIIPYGQDNFAFLTNENGVVNRNVVAFRRNEFNQDEAYSIPATNGNYGILGHQYNPASKSIADAIETHNGVHVYFRKIELPEPMGNLQAATREQALLSEEQFLNNSKKDALIREPEAGKGTNSRKSGNDANPTLQSRFNTENAPQSSAEDRKIIDSVSAQSSAGRVLYVDSTFIRLRSRPYRHSFKTDFYSMRIDNNQIFTRYQNFSGATLPPPDLGGMLSASVYDKMEDYRISAGYRLPVFSDGTAYYIQYDNFRRRTDWGLTYYRESRNLIIPLQITTPTGSIVQQYPMKIVANIVQGNVSYPLDRTKRISLNLALRQDRSTLKTTDLISNIIKNEDKYYVTSRAEFVHDDTRMKALNLPDGLRAKLFAEYLYKLHDDNVYSSVGGESRIAKGGFYNLGFDARHYTQIYKNVTFAIRAAFAHSGGNERILYLMGGVDNAINARTGSYPIGTLNYAFQSLTTTIRGYDQNSRNGNTYGLVNAELRVPVFETLFRKPVQASIWKNLQAIGFVDVGSAWEGLIPVYSNRGASRSGTFIVPDIPNSPSRIEVSIPYPGDDNMLIGFGGGLRTMLYGYFFRADAAWNINREFRLHLSLGLDF